MSALYIPSLKRLHPDLPFVRSEAHFVRRAKRDLDLRERILGDLVLRHVDVDEVDLDVLRILGCTGTGGAGLKLNHNY